MLDAQDIDPSAPPAEVPPTPDAPATAGDLLREAEALVTEAGRFAQYLRRYGTGGGGLFVGSADRIALLTRLYRAVCQIAASEVQAARAQQVHFNNAVQRLESKQREPILLQVQAEQTHEITDSYWVDVVPGGPSAVFIIHPPPGETKPLDQETVDRFAAAVEQKDPAALVLSLPVGYAVHLLRPSAEKETETPPTA